jgi:16S rRNA (adenine1518-N6/adenine1519-N6)-dimethyltransferase
VATPLILNLLLQFPRVRRYCFTVQAEVGERITAEPGGRDFGPLSILCQSLCTIATIARLRPQCFWPAPHVDSVMLRLDVRDHSLIPREEIRAFADFVRGVFDHRRKQLRAALAHAHPGLDPKKVPERTDLSRRPEQLAIDEWFTLYRALR